MKCNWGGFLDSLDGVEDPENIPEKTRILKEKLKRVEEAKEITELREALNAVTNEEQNYLNSKLLDQLKKTINRDGPVRKAVQYGFVEASFFYLNLPILDDEEIVNIFIDMADDIEIFKKLVEKGAKVNSGGNTILTKAVRDNCFERVKYILEKDPEQYVYGVEPIYYAIDNQNLEMLKFLVEHGFNILEEKFLPCAASTGNLEIVKYLVEKGVDITAENNKAIRKAARAGHIHIVKYLAEKGADLNVFPCIVFHAHKSIRKELAEMTD